MKANQAFKNVARDERANLVQQYMGYLVLAIVFSATIGIIASFAAKAQVDTNLTAAQQTLVGLVVTAVILAVVIGILLAVTRE